MQETANNPGQSKLSAAEATCNLRQSLEDDIFAKTNANQIKRKSVRGGAVTLINQGLKFMLTTGTTMVLARLLTPTDFGLQGMVLVMTGFVGLFSDIGLSMTTIQRDVITHEQTSTLFWLNVALGAFLGILVASLANVIVAFYHEPRLFWITIWLAATFLISGLGVQHSALLTRRMRFVALAKIQIAALLVSSVVSIIMAILGYGYWALVGSMVASPIITVLGMWLSVRWIPGRPHRGHGLRSALHFGGTLTLNNLVVYIGYNVEKILLGRFWGAGSLGLYGRAYSLVNLPTTQLHSSIYTVAFPALSRLQSNPQRLRNSFVQVYTMVVSLSIPVTICCMLFSEEMIHIVLGRKWDEAVPIFRLLGPTVLAFGMINPFGWFLIATGRAGRSFRISLLIAPAVILGILAGLHDGPKGVAVGYSTVMVLLIFPVILWAIHGTGITLSQILKAVKPPVLSGLIAALAGLAFKVSLGTVLTPVARLILGLILVLALYAWVLLVVQKQKAFFTELVSHLIKSKQPDTPEGEMG